MGNHHHNNLSAAGDPTREFYSKLAPQAELRTAWEIVMWWESKRLLFNASNIVAAIVGIILLWGVMPHLINPFGLPFLIGYGLLINLAYLAFWLPLVIIKKAWPKSVAAFYTSATFIFVIIFSSLITLGAFVAVVLFSIP